MSKSMSFLDLAQATKNSRSKTTLQIIGLFATVIVLEFITPNAYVFGYLYIGPILLANSRLDRGATVWTTLAAISLTLLNLVVPGGVATEASTITNRLVVTGVLSDRNRQSQKAITQQQAKLQAQDQLTRLREDFASTLTHDLKTPLLGAIETITAFQQGQFEAVSTVQKTILATMKRSHQNSLQLVETLLDVYRNDTDGLSLQLAPVDLSGLAQEVVSTLAEFALTRQVYLNCSYGESDFRRSLWVQGDAFQLQRVFANLVMNAINHSRRSGRVEMVLESQSSFQVVKILDTGAGIRPDEFSHLFGQFYQGNSDRQAKGAGLGLYLSRQIIEAHGGTIWAENRPSGGALFGFKLPFYVASSPETDTPRSPPYSPG
jgi:two-component system, NarL family, sensor kinase